MQASLQGKGNVIRQLKKQISQLQVTRSDIDRTIKVQTADSQITKLTEQVTNLQTQNNLFKAKNDKIKQHYKELYDSIKITRANHIEQVTALTTENMNLKAQTLEKVNSVNKDQESVETIHDIVEEAKVVRPLDRSIVSACRYTKHSQELLEYTIGTCPQGSQKRDKQLAHIPIIRKKQVTFAKPSDKLDSNTHKHVVKVKTRKTNVPVPPSTGVNSCPNASGSQTESNIKINRILPAKCVNKLPVKDQPRTNKSHLRTSNCVDSSSRLKRTVVQIILWYLDLGCSKHMTRDRSRLMNFVKKFIGTVRFENDHFGAIMGYGDYVIGYSVISRVYYVERLGHSLFSVGTPQQNGVVERRNRTLVEAARTMLIFSKAPMFLWAEAVATACYTQNQSLIHTRHHKTPYELVHNKKLDLTLFRVFGALCYLTNDSEDLGKLQPTADIGIFISLGLVPNSVLATPYAPPTNKELEILFQPMFDEYFEPPSVERPVLPAQAVQAPVNSAGTPSSTTIDQGAPSLSISPSSLALQSYSLHQGVAAEPTCMKDHFVAPVDNNPFVNVFTPEPHFEASSS
nr:integrase, catalytic region, zinc finger, CCHC-type, peptidase aspartic, catalytic [Tanacetum cinerariifolium]